jgi:hypothetical protein
MKRKCFTILCVLSLCVSLAAVSDTTEITYMCDNCNVQDICDKIETRLETEGEALIQYYNVCCRHCGEVIFEGSYLVSAVSPPADSEPQADPPADPVYIPPEDNDPPADTATGETPAVVVQSQPQSQPQTQPQPAVQPEQPVTIPASTGGSSGSSGGGTPAVTVVDVPAQQAQPASLSPVVVGVDTQARSVPSEGEDASGGQGAPSENPDPETDATAAAPNEGVFIPPRPQTRNYAKYPLFSVYYPSRRLNMEGDPDAWANIPGEKIYPISGSSLLTEMLNGGK